MKIKTPYSERTDSDKVFTNWTKTLALYERNEFSMSIVRAAVTIELAANLVIKSELISKRNLEIEFVNNLLRWANGLNNKFARLIIPLFNGNPDLSLLKDIKKQAEKVSDERNAIAHSGTFLTRRTALGLIEAAHQVVTDMVGMYVANFEIALTMKEQRAIKSKRD